MFPFFSVQSRAWSRGEELLSYNLELQDENKNNKIELGTMVLSQTEESSPSKFVLLERFFIYVRQTLPTQPAPD